MTDDRSWEMKISFWIDTDGYTDRDRQMFVCGVEYQMICEQLERGGEVQRPIHRENESRVRMLVGRFHRRCEITAHSGYDGCETWSSLHVFAEDES